MSSFTEGFSGPFWNCSLLKGAARFPYSKFKPPSSTKTNHFQKQAPGHILSSAQFISILL
uniref:Uncharacterized protein n=1 Tax=Anguilla anguilla TaxID=7936 RepID=A0A0E9VSW5_ANGAN